MGTQKGVNEVYGVAEAAKAFGDFFRQIPVVSSFHRNSWRVPLAQNLS